MKPTTSALPAPGGGAVTAISPPPDAFGVHYFDKSHTPSPCFVDEPCGDLECACRRLTEVRKGCDASAYLVRQTGPGEWKLYRPAVTA